MGICISSQAHNALAESLKYGAFGSEIKAKSLQVEHPEWTGKLLQGTPDSTIKTSSGKMGSVTCWKNLQSTAQSLDR